MGLTRCGGGKMELELEQQVSHGRERRHHTWYASLTHHSFRVPKLARHETTRCSWRNLQFEEIDHFLRVPFRGSD